VPNGRDAAGAAAAMSMGRQHLARQQARQVGRVGGELQGGFGNRIGNDGPVYRLTR
jgi:hypothetical protein